MPHPEAIKVEVDMKLPGGEGHHSSSQQPCGLWLPLLKWHPLVADLPAQRPSPQWHASPLSKPQAALQYGTPLSGRQHQAECQQFSKHTRPSALRAASGGTQVAFRSVTLAEGEGMAGGQQWTALRDRTLRAGEASAEGCQLLGVTPPSPSPRVGVNAARRLSPGCLDTCRDFGEWESQGGYGG